MVALDSTGWAILAVDAISLLVVLVALALVAKRYREVKAKVNLLLLGWAVLALIHEASQIYRTIGTEAPAYPTSPGALLTGLVELATFGVIWYLVSR